jgi:hypothetical protein
MSTCIAARRGLAAVVASVALLLLGAVPAQACTKSGFTGQLQANHAFFIGTATPEVVRAGAGPMEQGLLRRGVNWVLRRFIRGQVVEVERIGGPAAAHTSLQAGRMVLVPWSFGADCEPERWTDDARWIDAGMRGFFIGELRDSAQWVDGMPTFDVHDPLILPYPQRGAHRRGVEGGPEQPLSAEQMFSLHATLPQPDSGARSPEQSIRAMRDWAAAHPELARRPPAAPILSQGYTVAETQRIRGLDWLLAGTYRLTVTLTGVEPRVVYMRTASRPDGPWHLEIEDPQEFDPLRPRRAAGLRVFALAAPSLGELSTAQRAQRHRETPIRIREEPQRTREGNSIWRGEVDVSFLTAQLPADPLVRFFQLDYRSEAGRRAASREAEELPASFTLLPDGQVRVSQEIVLRDGRALRVSGERVSGEIVREPADRAR